MYRYIDQPDGLRHTITVCNRCHRPLDDQLEFQERIALEFVAGYGSVFGDGNTVRADFCQYCVQEVLGPWLELIEPPREHEAYRALQAHQIRPKKEEAPLLRALFKERIAADAPCPCGSGKAFGACCGQGW